MTLTTCERSFEVQTKEYLCIGGTGPRLEWRVEPVITSRPFRFLSDSPPQNRTVNNVVAILDSNSPFVSRLRITDDVGFETATVTCIVTDENVTEDYRRGSYGMLIK